MKQNDKILSSTINGHYAQYDFLRVLACFAVIAAHVATVVIFNDSRLDNPNWWVANFYDAAMRWCVPVFIMLTGALLIPKARHLTAQQFWKQKLPRLIIPALFWSCFYIFVSVAFTHNMDRVGFGLVAMGDEPFFHLWYFYFAILLYLLVPLFQRILDQIKTPTTITIIAASFAVSTFAGWPGFGGKYIALTGFALVSYLAIGYLLSTLPQLRLPRIIVFSCGAIACIWCSAMAASLLLPRYGYIGWEYVFSFSNMLVALLAVCIFRIVTSLKCTWNFAWLSRLTLGIYAIHPIWLVALSKIGITGLTAGPVVGIPLTSALVFILSALTVYALSSIKILRPVLH